MIAKNIHLIRFRYVHVHNFLYIGENVIQTRAWKDFSNEKKTFSGIFTFFFNEKIFAFHVNVRFYVLFTFLLLLSMGIRGMYMKRFILHVY